MLKKGQLNTLKDIVVKKYKEYENKVAIIQKSKNTNKYEEITYGDLRADIVAMSTALIKDYNLVNEKIAIIGENSYKWFVSYMAVNTGSGIVVPLDKELPSNEIENLINRSGAKCIIYSSKKKEIVESIKGNVSKKIIYIEMDKQKSDKESLAYDDVLHEGKKRVKKGDNSYFDIEISPEEFKMLMFTSGTTSASKGVMLCHRNIVSNINAAIEILPISEKDRMFSILPIHHIYEICTTYIYPTACGASIGICEGVKYVSKNIKELKPTVLVCVPLLIEYICKKIDKTIEEKGKTSLVRGLIKTTDIMKTIGLNLKKQIFKQIHESLGGKIKYILVAAAPISKDTINKIEGYGYIVIQGYGLTETAPLVSATRIKTRVAGTVGQSANCEVRINLEEGMQEGEIMVKGDNVMLGYYEDEEATKEVIRKGWFYTGDIGYFDDGGNLVITGRCKNVIVTSNGKNIYPEEIENMINKIPLVEESLVYGKEEKGNIIVAATVTLNKEYLKEKYGEDIPDKEQLQNVIWREIKEINSKMVDYKAVKKVSIKEDEFVKTTTMKIKRFLEENRK